MSVIDESVFAERVVSTRLWLTEFVDGLTKDRNIIELLISSNVEISEEHLTLYGDIPAYVDTVTMVQNVLADAAVTPNEILVALNVLFMEAVQHPLRTVVEADIVSETMNRLRGAGVHVIDGRVFVGRVNETQLWVEGFTDALTYDMGVIRAMVARGEPVSDELQQRWEDTPAFLLILREINDVLTNPHASMPWVMSSLNILWHAVNDNPSYLQGDADIVAAAMKRLQGDV